MGDFNVPYCKWDNNGCMPRGTKRSKGKQLNEFMENHFLTQKVNHPTRRDNILDLIFTNNTNIIESINISPTIHSDHDLEVLNTCVKS